MTEIDDYTELDARIKQLGQKTYHLLENIKNYNFLESGADGLDELYKIRAVLEAESDDIMNEIEVEDFLLHGSRMNNTIE